MKTKVLLGSLLVALTGTTYVSYQLLKNNDMAYVPRDTEGKEKIESFEGGGNITADEDLLRELRAMPNGEIDYDEILKAKKQVQQRLSKRSAIGLEWQFMGPGNIGGRTRSILVDRNNSNRVYAAAISGGLWYSDDAAGTWYPYDDLMDNLIASCIVQAPNGDLYLGTGNYFENFGGTANMPGGGIYRSTDGGETFNKIPSTDPETEGNQWQRINCITFDPNNSDIIYAGTLGGLYLSTDGGTTWSHGMSLNGTTGCTIDANGPIHDLEMTPTGILLVGYGGGLYRSETPQDRCTFIQITSGIPSSSSRIDLTVCNNDENIAYALTINGSGNLEGVYKSEDGGVNWEDLDPAPPSPMIDSTFNVFNGQGMYDMAIEVYPNDCDKIMLGGVETYQINNSWTRISENFAPKSSGIYIHSDKHYFEFDPNNPSVMYVASDGGVGKTINANASQPEWTDNNRYYGTTQLYGISFSKDGRVLGGTQDNGSFYIDPSLPGESQYDATEVLGGDGFDNEVSIIDELAFTTLYYGQVYRINATTGASTLLTGGYTDGTGNSAPFWTVVRLWENANDPTSKDSVAFYNDPTQLTIASGNGSNRNFTGTLSLTQDAAEVVIGSVLFRNAFGTTVQEVEDNDGDGILSLDNDSVGVIDYNSGEYDFTFDIAPANQSNVSLSFSTTFNAGDTLVLASNNQDYPFDYVLTTNLAVGDSVVVQDPVQTLMAASLNGAPIITRDAIKEDRIPEWFELGDVLGSGTPVAFEFSNDGNHLYTASSNRITRYSGINNLYSAADLSNVTATSIFTPNQGAIRGIALHPTDPEKLLVTVTGYGHSQHIYEITNAQSASGTASRVLKEGDLPQIPVYDAEYNVVDPSIVLIGTDFGVWSTQDINATSVEWSNENATLANTPVFDVRQQKLDYYEAENYHRFYLGTHGRGIWSTGSLVGTPEIDRTESKSADLGLKVYPNPVTSGSVTVDFTLSQSGSVHVRVFDLSGKMVREYNSRSFESGKNQYTFNTGELNGGSYIMTVEAGSTYSTAKFVVVK